MKPPSLEDCRLDESYFAGGDHIKAMVIIEDSILKQGKGNDLLGLLHFQQGSIFRAQARRTENSDVKFTFLLGSVECFAESEGFSSFTALSLFEMGQHLGSSMYYKKSVEKAKEYLSVLAELDELGPKEVKSQKDVERIIEDAESRIAGGKSLVASPIVRSEPKAKESKKNPDSKLRSFWRGLDDEFKRNFLKMEITKLISFVEAMYGKEGRDALDQVLTFARENRKWRFWMCRTCSKKFSSPEECKNHLGQEHAAEFKPSSTKDMPQTVSKVWGRKISVGGWDPVDAAAAVEMIKNRLQDVKAFAYENGWSKDWPLAIDEERSKLLKEIKLLLVSFWELEILSCSIRDWMMQFPVKHLAQFEVSEHTLTTECRLVETPQSICFLEFRELNQILHFLRAIKGERDDGKNLVCKAVDSFWDGTRVKEKIDFDSQFSFLLLDKRLLKCKLTRFDNEGTVNVFDPNDYYANAQVHGDDILSWLADYSLGDEIFRFPKPIRTHNIDIWVAVLRAVQFTCRTLRTKYEKKLRMICYDAALIDANNLCIREDERRRNIPKDQWTLYASLLCNKCEENIRRDAGDSLTTKLSLCAVRDVLGGASQPTFDFTDLVDCRNLINGHKHISDDIVLKSIDLLKSVVTYKVPLVDSKILLVENSRISLLKDLVSLSVFDYRSYILQPVKLYLEEELEDAAPPEILSEKKQEKEKKSGSKKRNHKSKKRTSASMSSHLDQDVEQAKEDSMELEDDTKGEKSLFEISSNTNNQEEATKDMQSMPREDLETVHGKAATRYNSALDMMLKSLCNIKVLKEDLVNNRKPFSDNQVPCALRDFFSGFVSEKIKEEELYGHLLSNLLASLEELHSLSSNAAEVLVAILEFCHCWKSPESESLVTRLFTLEEYERMSCRKCRRKPNYPEQSSYGIVMAADSIRDLECALGNIMFEDILKVIRMNNEMICDVGTGGCGERNLVHHTISRCPPIFTIVLEWEKNETEIEIYETTNALHWEIDISRLYEGLEPNTNYRLVSMIGCVEEGEYICMAYEKNRWVSRRHEASAEEVVGNWKSVVKICGERKIRSEVLFYEAVQ
ncbi:putative transcription factor C2H2 family [Arabidopsis thaliana]